MNSKEGSFDLVLLVIHGHHNADYQLSLPTESNKFLFNRSTKATYHKGQGHLSGELVCPIQPFSLDIDEISHPVKVRIRLGMNEVGIFVIADKHDKLAIKSGFV